MATTRHPARSGLELTLRPFARVAPQNTARQALLGVSRRVEKYVGKTVVDTFAVRAGDALTSVRVWASGRAALPTKTFATINLALVSLVDRDGLRHPAPECTPCGPRRRASRGRAGAVLRKAASTPGG